MSAIDPDMLFLLGFPAAIGLCFAACVWHWRRLERSLNTRPNFWPDAELTMADVEAAWARTAPMREAELRREKRDPVDDYFHSTIRDEEGL